MSETIIVSSVARTSGLHRFAVIGVVCSLAGVLTGAMVTSSGGTSFSLLHEMVAGAGGIVAAILGVWITATLPVPLSRLGWGLLAMVAAECALGFVANVAGVGVLHAILAQLLFAVTAAASTATSAEWQTAPDLVEDHGWPSLGSLGRLTPVLVLLQVAMGAAFRHKEMGVLPHLLGAMIIVIVILCECIFVTQQFPTHTTLRPAANHLMAIAFTQVFLGIAAFTVRTMNTVSNAVLLGVTATHALVGAATLAAAVVLGMQIRRNVFKPAEPL